MYELKFFKLFFSSLDFFFGDSVSTLLAIRLKTDREEGGEKRRKNVFLSSLLAELGRAAWLLRENEEMYIVFAVFFSSLFS